MLKNPSATKAQIIQWIRSYFAVNGKECMAIIGLSGGKDSAVAAALCVEALGKDRVIGVFMPNGRQSDIADAYDIAEHLDIKALTVNIKDMFHAFKNNISMGICDEIASAFINENRALEDFYYSVKETDQMLINLPPRIRMTTLYAIAQMLPMGGRVVNTCNASEDYIGYSTKYGDAAGDFSPLSGLLVSEVMQIGDALGLPYDLVHKTPADGLCGKTDEDKLGFTYDYLEHYILCDGVATDPTINAKIEWLHNVNLHKLKLIPNYHVDITERV